MHVTIYRLDGSIYTDGLQSSVRCDEAIRAARRIARDIRQSVVVEDRGSSECYRITPAGHRWRAPKAWATWAEARENLQSWEG